MTRQTFLRFFFTLLLVSPYVNLNINASAKAIKTGKQMKMTVMKTVDVGNPVHPLPHPAMPGLTPPAHKMYIPMMEELAKIHRFHRERLRRVRKLRQQCWISAKLLLILCHAALLICAYLHSTH